jgi:copper transport protein
VLVVTCWLVLPAVPASAHAVLVATDPALGSAVPDNPPPKEVVLTFSEPVKIRFGGVRVFDSSLKRVDTGEPRFVNDHTVAIGVKRLADGGYIVAWRVISADTHPVRGAFRFDVGSPTGPTGPMGPTGSDGGRRQLDTALGEFSSAPRPVLVAADTARTLGYGTALLLFGPLLFLLIVWRPRAAGEPADRGMVGAAARLLRRVWPAAVAANLLVLVTEAATEAGVPLARGLLPSTLGPVLGSTFGHVWIVRMVLLAALAPLLLRLSGSLSPAAARQPARSVGAMAASPQTLDADTPSGVSVGQRGPTWIAALLAAGVVVAPAFWGHATTTSPKALAIASDATHLLSVSAWVGGLWCLLFLVPRVLRDADPGERAAAMARTVPRFSKLGLVSVALLVASGTYLAIRHVTTWKALFGSTYGLVVVAKIVGLALALVLGAFNLFRTQRRLRATEGTPEESDVWARRLRRAVGGEALITAVVIVLASVLVSLAPPRTSGAAGAVADTFSVERVAIGPDTVDVQVFPPRAGQPVQVHTEFTTSAGGADDGVAEVSISLTLVDQDLGPFDYEGVKLAPGHYVMSGFTFPAPGRWRMELKARRGEFDEYDHTFEFPVG